MEKVKTEKQKTGKWGEEEACRYLEARQYKILSLNYRFSKAEVDIIAQRENTLVFFEVKVRKNARYGMPETFASLNQRNRIRQAAGQYQIDNQFFGFIRFDIISILGKQGDFEILHLEDAF
jgi:putative endonuclease